MQHGDWSLDNDKIGRAQAAVDLCPRVVLLPFADGRMMVRREDLAVLLEARTLLGEVLGLTPRPYTEEV